MNTTKRRPSDADALVAVLAWERCHEMAERSQDDLVREGWRRDAEAAWAIVERWLAPDRRKGDPITQEPRHEHQ